jgi:hypothetical protein
MSAHAIHLQALYIQARVEGFDGLAVVLGELLRREVTTNADPGFRPINHDRATANEHADHRP